MADMDHDHGDDHGDNQGDGPGGLNGDGNGGIQGGDHGDVGSNSADSWGSQDASSDQADANFDSNSEESSPQEGDEAPQLRNPMQEHMFFKAFDRYKDLPQDMMGTPDFRAVRMPTGGYFSPRNSNVAPQGDGDTSEIAPFAKPVRDWMLGAKIVDPATSYIGGIPASAWNSFSPETQEQLRQRFDGGYIQAGSYGLGLPASTAIGVLMGGAPVGSQLLAGAFGGLITGFPGLALDRVNQPLIEHPGSLYTNLLDRAASPNYD